MQMHQLKSPKGSRKRKRIIGRGHGSGAGKTAGRGENGQRSRSGRRGPVMGSEGGQMPLIRRLPKVGFTNRNRVLYQVVKLSQLEKLDANTEVDAQVLKNAHIIGSVRKPYKVLGNGSLTKALTIKAHRFSKTAEDQIKKAGGTAELIQKQETESK